MSDRDTTLDRRTFVKGTGAAAVGAAVTSGAASAQEAQSSADGRTDSEGEEDDSREVTLVAHRGFAGVNPENTVRAVRNASNGWTADQRERLTDVLRRNVSSIGGGEIVIDYNEDTAELVRDMRGGGLSGAMYRQADMIEVDVMPCGDGDIVVFHDDQLSSRDGGTRGLTDAEGTVWETDCETVTSAEVLESGETVPLLTEVMDAIPSEVGVNLEFKANGNMSWDDFADRTLSIAADYDNEILVSSFAEDAIAAVAEDYPDVPIAFLFWNDIEAGLEVTDEYDCDAMNVPYNMVQGTPFFSDDIGYGNVPSGGYADVDLVSAADERDIELNVWTIQSWYQADQLVDADVDGLISDFPNVL
jgi:glycerophosphoryl diester phosphodiesterase